MVVQARVADYLKNERCELKLTAIAEKAGIKQPRFSALINCKSEMRADELMKICDVLEVSSDRFIRPRCKLNKGG